jgi:hypothetical protein
MSDSILQGKLAAAFWKTVSEQEFREIIDRGGILNAEQCARLWRIEERQTEPPKALEILIWKPDLDRLIRKLKRQKPKR